MRYDSLAGEESYTNTHGIFTLLFLAVFLTSILPNPLSQKVYLLAVMVGAFNYVTEEKSPG